MDRGLLRLALCAIVAVAIAGCNSTTESGRIGATLSGQGVTVTLKRVDHHAPYSASAFNGPAPGFRLLGAHVRVCSTNGQAINEYAFTIVQNDGSQIHATNGERNYPQGFNALSTGCSEGWILFQIPRHGSATEIRFAFDANGGNPGSGGPPEAHVHFSWKL